MVKHHTSHTHTLPHTFTHKLRRSLVTFTSRSERDAEQEVLATINTSLLPEPDGYTFKLLKRVLVQTLEVVAFLAPSSASPEWVYTYR